MIAGLRLVRAFQTCAHCKDNKPEDADSDGYVALARSKRHECQIDLQPPRTAICPRRTYFFLRLEAILPSRVLSSCVCSHVRISRHIYCNICYMRQTSRTKPKGSQSCGHLSRDRDVRNNLWGCTVQSAFRRIGALERFPAGTRGSKEAP